MDVLEATSESFIGAAPVIVVTVALDPEYVMPGGAPAHPIDIAIALDHMTLVAAVCGTTEAIMQNSLV